MKLLEKNPRRVSRNERALADIRELATRSQDKTLSSKS